MLRSNSVSRIGWVVIAIILLMGMCTGLSFAQQGGIDGKSELVSVMIDDPTEDGPIELQLHPAEAKAYSDLKTQQPVDRKVIAFYGEKRSLLTKSEKLSLANGLYREISDNVNIDPKWQYPEGPILSWGVTGEGHLLVAFEEGASVSSEMMDAVYEVFQREAGKHGVSKLPLEFRYERVPETLRVNRWRPAFGGIQVEDTGGFRSTLAFAATKGSTKGFVVSGHAFPYVSAPVYQPTKSSSNELGRIDSVGKSYSDASWVTYVSLSNIAPKVYVEFEFHRTVKNYYDPQIGSYIYKSGRSTGITAGNVIEYRSSVYHPDFGSLKNQVATNLNAAQGDSGSPVYRVPGGSDCDIVGVLWGQVDGYRFFSPISGVYRDLGVYPLKG